MSPPASSTSKDSNPPSPKERGGAATPPAQKDKAEKEEEERKFESINALRAKAREHEAKLEENANKSDWIWISNFPAKLKQM